MLKKKHNSNLIFIGSHDNLITTVLLALPIVSFAEPLFFYLIALLSEVVNSPGSTNMSNIKHLSKKEFWIMTIAGFCSMCIEGLMDSVRSVTFPLIKEHFDASYEEFGVLNSMANVGYVVFASLCSVVLPYIGFKNGMIIGSVAGIILSIWLSYAPSFLWCIIIQFLFGICFGFGDIPPQTLGTMIFTEKSGFFMALLNAFYGVGCMLGPLLAGIILTYVPYGYQGVYLIMTALILILGLVITFSKFTIFSMTDAQEESEKLLDPQTSDIENGKEKPGSETVKEDEQQQKKCCNIKNPVIRAAFKPTVMLFIITLTMLTLVERSGMNWSGVYIKDYLHMDPEKEGAMFNTIYFALYTVTRLFGGLLTDKLGAMNTIYCTLILTMILLLIGFFTDVVGLWIICSTGALVSLFWPSFIIVSTDYFGEEGTAAVGAILPLQSLVAAIFQPILGWFNSLWGAAWSFRFTFVFASCALLLLFVISCLIKKKKSSQEVTH